MQEKRYPSDDPPFFRWLRRPWHSLVLRGPVVQPTLTALAKFFNFPKAKKLLDPEVVLPHIIQWCSNEIDFYGRSIFEKYTASPAWHLFLLFANVLSSEFFFCQMYFILRKQYDFQFYHCLRLKSAKLLGESKYFSLE